MGRYNEYENLRKAGVTYADITGYQFDRHDVTARGIANWYAQTLGTIFTESPKPFEVEIVVAEVGVSPSDDQIYRITFDGSVTDEPGFVAFGGQADQVSAALKERYSDDMSLSEAFAAARGVASPTQLRNSLKQDGRDLLTEFRRMAPEREQVSIQRWSLRRVLLTVAVAFAAFLAVGLVVSNWNAFV